MKDNQKGFTGHIENLLGIVLEVFDFEIKYNVDYLLKFGLIDALDALCAERMDGSKFMLMVISNTMAMLNEENQAAKLSIYQSIFKSVNIVDYIVR